jgi:alpha-1,6-mannosyltransferase
MSSIVLALISAFALVSMGDLSTRVPSAISIMVVWGGLVWVLPRPKFGLSHLLWVALAVRLILVWGPASLSDDVFRYLWEGHVAWSGANPYLHAPSSPELDSLGEAALRARVAHDHISAIYPPLAIWFFGLLAQFSTEAWIAKLAMGLADVGVVWTLALILQARHRHLGPAWLYALHPLGAVESAGSGHMESLALLCVLQAIYAWERRGEGSAWAALGMWIKLLPVVLLPRVWRGRPWLFVVAMGVGVGSLWPFLDAGPAMMSGMRNYVHHWSFNGALFPVF